jgi:prevent-host-death family protein
VRAFEPAVRDDGEVVITVRGRHSYVVMSMDHYNRMRVDELDRAVREARADYKAGRVADRDVKSHIKRLAHEV